MARPTEEVKTKFIGLRLTEDEYNSLKGNKSEAIRELIGSVKHNIGSESDSKELKEFREKFNELKSRLSPDAVEDFESGSYGAIKIVPIGSVLSDASMATLQDIESMVKLSGGTIEKFLTDLDTKLMWEAVGLKDGLIDVEDHRELDETLRDLEDACAEKGVDVAEAIKKTARSVWGIRQ